MNPQVPRPFDINNSFICQYLESCIFNIEIEDTKWLLKTYYLIPRTRSSTSASQLQKNQIFRNIIDKINLSQVQISDYIDLTDPSIIDSIDDFIEVLRDYRVILFNSIKSNEDLKLIEKIKILSPVATGRSFEADILIKYINLIAKKNPEVVPLNISMSFTNDQSPFEPKFKAVALSISLLNDVFEPINKFIRSNDPAAKIIFPILRNYALKQKNYWLLLVIHKETAEIEKTGEKIIIYVSSLYSPFEIDHKIQKLVSIKNYFSDCLLREVKELFIKKNETHKIDILNRFIKNWKIHVVPRYHQHLAKESSIQSQKYNTVCANSGVAVLEFARHIVYNIKMNFQELNIQYYRERIIRELFKDELIAPGLKERYDHRTYKYKLYRYNALIYVDYLNLDNEIFKIIGIQKYDAQMNPLSETINPNESNIINLDEDVYDDENEFEIYLNELLERDDTLLGRKKKQSSLNVLIYNQNAQPNKKSQTNTNTESMELPSPVSDDITYSSDESSDKDESQNEPKSSSSISIVKLSSSEKIKPIISSKTSNVLVYNDPLFEELYLKKGLTKSDSDTDEKNTDDNNSSITITKLPTTSKKSISPPLKTKPSTKKAKFLIYQPSKSTEVSNEPKKSKTKCAATHEAFLEYYQKKSSSNQTSTNITQPVTDVQIISTTNSTTLIQNSSNPNTTQVHSTLLQPTTTSMNTSSQSQNSMPFGTIQRPSNYPLQNQQQQFSNQTSFFPQYTQSQPQQQFLWDPQTASNILPQYNIPKFTLVQQTNLRSNFPSQKQQSIPQGNLQANLTPHQLSQINQQYQFLRNITQQQQQQQHQINLSNIQYSTYNLQQQQQQQQQHYFQPQYHNQSFRSLQDSINMPQQIQIPSQSFQMTPLLSLNNNQNISNIGSQFTQQSTQKSFLNPNKNDDTSSSDDN